MEQAEVLPPSNARFAAVLDLAASSTAYTAKVQGDKSAVAHAAMGQDLLLISGVATLSKAQ